MDFTRTVSKLTQDELGKRQDYRPVYSLHKYWARRAGSQFRAILLRLVSSEGTLFIEDEFGGLSPESDYFQSHGHDFDDLVVLDPFMGGGTTLIEANRLGAKVIGCDLSPLSWWIVREGLKPIDLERFDHYTEAILERAREEVGPLYTTLHTSLDEKAMNAQALYYFWVREATCEKCEQKVTLHSRTNLNRGLKRGTKIGFDDPATTVCLDCGALGGWSGRGEYVCKNCGVVSDPSYRNFSNGKFKHCDREQTVLNSVKKFGKLGERLIAVEYIHPLTGKRVYKCPDEEDAALIERCKEQVSMTREDMIIPDADVPSGDSSQRWRKHEYVSFSDVFFARQLVAIDAIAKAIMQVIPEDESSYQDSFLTCLSNSLEYNNSMVPYNFPHRKLHHLFTHHALPVTMMPVENNVLGTGKEGSGTFTKCVQRYRKGKAYSQNVFDGYKHAEFPGIRKISSDETIQATMVDQIRRLQDGNGKFALLMQGDSSIMHEPLPARRSTATVPGKSVDLVVTDPPYYDSVHYSELANFFYVWLRAFRPETGPFSMPLIDAEREAIVNKKHSKGAREYEDIMTAVFESCHHVLKDGGAWPPRSKATRAHASSSGRDGWNYGEETKFRGLAFTFHHQKTEAWWTVIRALGRSGFVVVQTFAVESEYKVNPHIREKETLDMDLVIICDKADPKDTKRDGGLYNFSDFESRLVKSATQDHDNPNWQYLEFMGMLLENATSCFSHAAMDYDWFSGTIEEFNEFVERRGSRLKDDV